MEQGTPLLVGDVLPANERHRAPETQSRTPRPAPDAPSTAYATEDATEDADRYRRFGEAIDTIRSDVEAKIGEEDLKRVRRLDRFSRAMEIAGRVLIHVSLDPLTFSAGVLALFVHKQLQATEIGHTALHGAYDRIPGVGRFHSRKFRWDVPIDEESWRSGHNVKHHQFTNIAGKDPDIHFGPVRLTDKTPHRFHHYVQLPFALAVLFPNFTFMMNLHFTGLHDVYFGNGRPERFDVIKDRSWKSVRQAHLRALRKYAPYYLKNYVFFPALAGPFFFKVLFGNWLAETMRDIYSAATIYCGHVGEGVASFEASARAKGRGRFYAMQCEATNDFEVSRPVSLLCGGLDRQIEHHLFPHLPPERLREIAPRVREACAAHGVSYRTGSWGSVLKKALRHIAALSRKSPDPVHATRALLEAAA